MKERPILFSSPMVIAIGNGTKTQTRRVCKIEYLKRGEHTAEQIASYLPVCPYGEPGDRLWVRERLYRGHEYDHGCNGGVKYFADDTYAWDVDHPVTWVWQRNSLPSIHMPRGLCRTVLEITGRRIERLQRITEADAIAEGVDHDASPPGVTVYPACVAFQDLWISINGRESWEANPFVWVVEFSKVSP